MDKSQKSDDKLEYFRKLLLDHLDTLEDGKVMAKAKAANLNEVRTRKDGKRYKKIAEGDWRPVYDSHTRGAKMAIAAIKRKVAAAKDAHEMMQIVLKNHDRFSDEDGYPLPFVQELSKYISEKSDALDNAAAKKDAKNVKAKEKRAEKKEKGEAAKGEEKPKFEKIPIGKVEKWLVDSAKEVGLDIEGYEHEITNEFHTHVMNYHGNEKTESKRGNIAIKESDFAQIPSIIEKPDYTIVGGKRKDKSVIVYAKKVNDGSTLYFEEILDGKDNRTLRGKTMYKRKGDVDEKNLTAIVTMNEKTDLSEAKIVIGGGGHSPSEAGKTDLTAATPAHPADTSNISQSGEKSSGFEGIKAKYKAAKAVEGDEDELAVGKETITGTWKLVEAETPTASHDEATFHKTEGFPTNEDGSTINDRDYEKDRDAQEVVLEIASDYDMQALSFDSPVIVTKDGIVISGNNRTMSSKIAAKKGTDTKYVEALKKKARKFGFTAEQIGQFKHPRVVFETDFSKGYSTEQFAKFNERDKKAMNPIESAIKVSKIIKSQTVESIAERVSEFDTLGELYANKKAVSDIFNALQRDNIIGQFDRPQYVTDDGITGAGKEFLETVLVGSVMNEQNIRALNREGCKSIRQKLVRAITPLIENKGMKGYSITEELNKAVDIVMQVAIQKDKWNSVAEYEQQQNMFETDDRVSIELAKKMEGTQKEFAEFMHSINGGLKIAANGEADIFLGGVETREDILSRFLSLKKSLINRAVFGALKLLELVRGGKASLEKKKVVLKRSGDEVETYRWIADNGTDKMLELDLQGVAPYTENIPDPTDHHKTIAIDFDGVINSYISGWQGETQTDAPVLSAMESISDLFNRGYKLIIFSTRAQSQEGIKTIREYIRKHAENNLLADSIEITDKKPIADMYVDDRAIPFTGDWKETLDKIETFKPWIAKGGFIEGQHQRDENGRFSETGSGGNNEKWFRYVLTDSELKQFIDDARSGKEPGNALIGMVSDSTKEEVKRLIGVEVNKIVIEGTTIAHADEPKHHLRDGDIEKCAKIVNNPISVKLSGKTNEQGLKIIEFKGNIDGVIYFAEAVHKKHGGWLSLASVYRPQEQKVSGTPMPPDGSPELTSEAPRPMPSDQNIPHFEEKSSGDFKKSLTYSGFPLQGRTKVQGMDISIENKKGSTRSGTDKDGHEWKCFMHNSYGYIRGTVGVDKDHLDCIAPETKILMSDYTEKLARDIQVGDMLIASQENPDRRFGHRKQMPTKVVNIDSGSRKMLKIILSDGREIKTTCGHLHYIFKGNGRDKIWKRADELKVGNNLVSIYKPTELVEDEEYRRGYLFGAYKGDGTINFENGQLYCDIRKGIYGLPVIERVKSYWSVLGLETADIRIEEPRQTTSEIEPGRVIKSDMNMAKLSIRGRLQVEFAKPILTTELFDSTNWCRGYLAGFYDTDGSLSVNKEIQICQIKDQKMAFASIAKAMKSIGFNSKVRGNCIYISGDWCADNASLQFTQIIKPALFKKRDFTGQAFRYEKVEIIDIQEYEGDFIAIQTELGTYIANGLFTHNCYVGPNPESEIVYIVNQNDPTTGEFDEQKVMLGFNSEKEAKAAYLKQYDRPGFFGDIVKMDIDTFKEEAFNPDNKGKPLQKGAA